jgi:hypothetical protein
VIIYCIINAVSVKNSLFNDNVLKRKREKEGKPPKGHAGLKRVK